MLGWISPDDRLWRHPSESGASAGGPPTILAGKDRSGSRIRTGPWIVGGTACIVLVLVAAGLVMATTPTSDPDDSGATPGIASLTAAPTTEVGIRPTVGMASLAAMVSSIRQSTVIIEIAKSAGPSVTTGLVAEAGGIVVMSAAVLSGAKSIVVIEPSGSRRVATVIGIDQSSGLAVVSIGDDLPAATFDSDDPPTGGVIYAVALEAGHQANASPSPVVYAGKVLSTGHAVDVDAVTSKFVATAMQVSLSHNDLGCPLLDTVGHVSGLLEKTVQVGASTVSVFLPAELVLGVTRQLVSSGTVIHGWFGAHTSDTDPPTTTSTTGSSAQPPAGARLDAVDAGSPAAASLAPGDIITAIDGFRVQSSAELQTRLYADPPGTAVDVTILRGGTSMKMPVTLAAAEPDAPGSHPAP
jgi:S1-C subfamily serine protease